MAVSEGKKRTMHVHDLSLIHHNISRWTRKTLHGNSRHCLGMNDNSPKFLDRALCRSHRTSSMAVEQTLRIHGG